MAPIPYLPAIKKNKHLFISLLVFLSLFQNGITIIFNVKFRMISFLIISVFFGIFIYKGISRRFQFLNFEKLMIAWLIFGFISFLANFRFGLSGSVAYALVFAYMWQFSWMMIYFGVRFTKFSEKNIY